MSNHNIPFITDEQVGVSSQPKPFKMVARANLALCDDIAATLTAVDRTDALAYECASSETLTEDILRNRLSVLSVPGEHAEAFIAKYRAAKSR